MGETPSFLNMFILNMVHILSFLFPRSKKIWVFGSWNGKVFMDNSKYFYLFASQNVDGIIPIWISQNRSLVKLLTYQGYTAYYMWDIKGILYSLRAKYFFIDHGPAYEGLFSPLNIWLSGGAKIIQLFHGIPLKKIGVHNSFLNSKTKLSKVLSLFSRFNLFNVRFNTYIIAPSKNIGIILASAFQLPKNRIIINGLPRNDGLRISNDYITSRNRLYDFFSKLKDEGNKLIFYIPTFRDTGGNSFTDKVVDLNKLADFLKEKKCFFITKFHQADTTSVKIGDFERINILSSGLDLYELLSLCDILITDYSSVFFDFLLLDKPIIFFAYDLEKYKTHDREFYFNYESFVPGPIASKFEELLYWIDNFLKEKSETDNYKEKRARIRSFVFEKVSFNSSKELFRSIINMKK